ncbi:hypothetical protein [Acetivibrio cellulolyticus]|uniref:hypothetical protein n=1 Tax=Acetivibrio cellulolyticus TaxID=35830 RepID=UPI0001E2C1B8|nr:hypothetical protein [Acetivibrio cellulolyticus]
MKENTTKFTWCNLKIRKVLSAITATAIAVSLVSTCFASTTTMGETTKKITAKDGRVVTVTYLNGTVEKVPDSHIQDILKNNPDGENIRILEVGYAKPNAITITPNVGLPTWTSPVIKTVFTEDELESDRFMDSCAKGEEKTESRDITAKLCPASDGNALAKIGLKLNGEISYSIKKGTKLVGPPESSTRNSREYRCKFYRNTGIWERFGIISGIPYYFWGNFSEPTYFESYSIDKLISR